MKNKLIKLSLLSLIISSTTILHAQFLQIPDGVTNHKCTVGRKVGATNIDIKWNAPGVKGREGKIWGTNVAWFDFVVLGYGSNRPSPWRAGADECTNISFSTEVKINGKTLAAGKYALFMALYADSIILIFNKNSEEWGSYFYNKDLDVLRVKTIQKKDQAVSVERLNYTFNNLTKNSIEIALEWEHWKIPFTIETDLVATTLASIRSQMIGAMGFDPPSMEAAANWCLKNNVNFEQAYNWINTATDPNFGAVVSFNAITTKAGLLSKMGKQAEADKVMKEGMTKASPTDLHNYGRQLLSENKTKDAMLVFEMNFKNSKGAWPTNADMMRGYSALGNLKLALKHAKVAAVEAPNPETKKIIEEAVKTLESGKAL